MISNETCRSQYSGNDAATEFAYLFPLLDKSFMRVVLTDDNDLDTLLVVDVDYSVNGVGSADSADWTINYPISGSPLPSGYKITLLPDQPFTQLTNFSNQGGFYPETHTRVADYITVCLQQLKEITDRCVKVGVGQDPELSSDLLILMQEYAAAASASASAASVAKEGAEASAEAAAEAAESISPYDNNQYVAGSGANTYTASLTPSLPAYITGMEIAVKFSNANTGAATLNIDGLGAKSIQNKGAALAAGDIAANLTGILRYDGSAFQLLNPNFSAPAASPIVPVRQTALFGSVNVNGLPNFLPATSGSLSLTSQNISASVPLIVAAAGGFGLLGAIDRIGRVTSNLTWSGLTANATNYLSLIVAADGKVTTSATTNPPIYSGLASASNFRTDRSTSAQAISGGDYVAYPASGAFDNVTSGAVTTNMWASSQIGTGVSGVAWIGQNFGASPKRIQRIAICPYVSTSSVTSALVQHSDDGTNWTTATTLTLATVDNLWQTFDFADSGSHQYWRLLANANPSGGSASWVVREIEMMDLVAYIPGQFVFDYIQMVGTWGEGSSYAQSYRVFVGEAVTSGSAVTSTVAYAYQGKFETLFASPAASTNTEYNHNIGVKPRHVRTFMVCTATESGWAVGDEVDIQGPSFGSGYVVSGNPVSCVGNNTARYSQGDINPRLASISSPGSYFNTTRANWSVKSVLQRGW